MRFSEKVAIITGAGNGIGKATGEIIVREGGRLGAVDIDASSLESLVSDLAETPGEVAPQISDAFDPDQVEATVTSVLDRWGHIDILVNCVGGSTVVPDNNRPVEEFQLEEWERIMDFNLKATFLYCKAVLPHMKKQGSGKIVNLSSIAATGLVQSGAAYSSAKGGIISFTSRVAQEAGPYGINVNAVAPSMTLSARVAEQRWAKRPPEVQKAMLARVAMRRIAVPEDQARVIAFLASEDADYVSGQTISVNGGQ